VTEDDGKEVMQMGNARTWAISAAATVVLVAGALLASGAVSFAQTDSAMPPDGA
jgi:hypothetical protein